MAEPYIGEIRLFAGTFAPLGYMFCQGQSLSISDYPALFSLLGTFYGGYGQNTFSLPNLQSRLAIHAGSDSVGDTYPLGQTGGSESVTLTTNNLPFHNHSMLANNNGGSANSTSGAGGTFGNTSATSNSVYGTGGSATLSTKAISSTGGNQSHSNIKPFLCVNFIIATEGQYPTQN